MKRMNASICRLLSLLGYRITVWVIERIKQRKEGSDDGFEP